MQGIGSSIEGYLTGSQIFWKLWSYVRISSQKFENHGYMSESVIQFLKIHGYVCPWWSPWEPSISLSMVETGMSSTLLVTTSNKVHSECIWEEHFTKLRTREAFYFVLFSEMPCIILFFLWYPLGTFQILSGYLEGGKTKNELKSLIFSSM
jgi:hypothetical protein